MSTPAVSTARLVVSVDVEDWPQSTLDHSLPIGERVVANTRALLELMADANVKATFFVLGKVADDQAVGDVHGAAVDVLLAGDDPKDRRLPRAVRADEADLVAAVDLEVLVDTGAGYSVVPRPLLDGLGYQPVRTQRVVLADGRIEEWPLSQVVVECQGRRTPTPMLMGPAA